MRISLRRMAFWLACFALLGRPVAANEILDVLTPPVAPADDDAPSPSDVVLPSSGDPLLTDSGCDGDVYESVVDSCCSPLWSFTVGTVYLHRSQPGPAALAVDPADPATVLLDAAGFDLRSAWGVEASALRRNAFGTAWDLEGRYFGANSWNSTIGPVDSANGADVPYLAPIGDDSEPAELGATYSSELRSFEMNARRAYNGWLQYLVGVRFFEVDELLAINHDVGPGIDVIEHRIGAVNQLWGFQLGAEARLWQLGRLSLDGFLKAGVYGNSIDNSVRVTGGGFDASSTGSGNGAAFAGELGFVGLYRLNDRWSVRASYQMLWLNSVALAPDQIAVSDPLNGINGVDNSGELFYHGGFLGAQFDW